MTDVHAHSPSTCIYMLKAHIPKIFNHFTYVVVMFKLYERTRQSVASNVRRHPVFEHQNICEVTTLE